MKILAVSDVVEPSLYKDFDPGRFPGIDLVLACGDLPPEYLRFLANAFNAPIYYVHGNHDIRHERNPPTGAINIHGRLVDVSGLRVLGLEGSRWYNGGPFQYREREMQALIRRLRLRIWLRGAPHIVVTHAPPLNVGDAEDRCHRGFESFHGLIKRYAPRYLLHGHIHRFFEKPQDRITRLHQTRVVNCYGYFVFDY